MLRDFLRKEGHTVGEAENGDQAIRRVREGHYDLILLDYKMPDDERNAGPSGGQRDQSGD